MAARIGSVVAVAWLLVAAACLPGGPLRIEAVTPGEGSSGGGTMVLIRGSGFSPATLVTFGDVAAPQIVFIDPRTLQVRTPPGSGRVDVVVRSAYRSARLVGGFVYKDGAPSCRPVGSSPAFAATDVPVGESLSIQYDVAVDPSSLARVTLSRLEDGAPVAASATLGSDGRTVTVTPATNLRFWGAYALVAEGVRASGAPCESFALAFSTWEPAAIPSPARPAAAEDVVVLGTTAITSSPTYRGLQVYDVADPTRPTLAGEVRTAFSPGRLTVERDRLYVAAGGGGVAIFDVTSPRAPRQIGSVATTGNALEAVGFTRGSVRWLAVADGPRGVRLVDVTNPLQPAERSSIHTGGARGDSAVFGVAVRGDQLWIAAGVDGLFVYNVAAPAAPTLLGRIVTERETTAVAPAPDGRWVYAGRSFYGLDVVDAADPTTPVLVANVLGPSGQCGVDCLDGFYRLTLDAAGGRLLVPLGRPGVAEFTVGADGQLTLARTLATSGHARGVAAGSSGVLFSASEDGLASWPVVGTAALTIPSGGGLASALALAGDLVYVAARTRGLETWRLGPGAPTLLGRDATPASLARRDVAAMGIALVPGQILVGDGRQGLARFDRSVAADPVLVGGTLGLDTTQIILVDQPRGLAYVCAGNIGFAVFDLSGAGAPVLRAQRPFDVGDACLAMERIGDTVYVAGLRLWTADVSNPAAPVWVGAPLVMPRGDLIVGLAVTGTRLVASTFAVDAEGIGGRRRGLAIFDVATPRAPALAVQTADVGGSGTVRLAGGKAFVSAGTGVFVFDLAPTIPFLEGVVPTPGQVVDVALAGSTLHTVEFAGGLRSIAVGPFRP